ncbi:MAG: SDR family oxidoreductase [Hamadaea sp.]|nr:SDR family oxidoreductase [Hamadaea sp.]
MALRWLVTGCSSGVGRALVRRLADEGEQVVATARRPETLADLTAHDSVVTARLDVRDPEQCAAAVQLAVDRFGGIDVLVNNAGYGQFGAVEEVSGEQLEAQFATNFFGPWRLTSLVLPLWRAQGGGRALFVSSTAGFTPYPGLAAYTSSKFALEGMAESLAQEAVHLGVKVTILQLGGFATGYGRSIIDAAAPVEAYAQVHGGMRDALRGFENLPGLNDPAVFADVALRVARLDSPPLRVPVGPDAEQHLTAALEHRAKELTAVVDAGLDGADYF